MLAFVPGAESSTGCEAEALPIPGVDEDGGVVDREMAKGESNGGVVPKGVVVPAECTSDDCADAAAFVRSNAPSVPLPSLANPSPGGVGEVRVWVWGGALGVAGREV